MKKLLIIFIAIWGFLGCKGLLWDGDWKDIVYSEYASNHNLYYGNFDTVKALDYVVPWIWTFVRYAVEVIDVWSSPRTTVERGYGDCDDIVILAMNIAYVVFGIKFDLVLVNTLDVRSITGHVCPFHDYSRSSVGGGSVNHAMIYRNGKVYEAQRNLTEPVNIAIEYIYPFDEVLNL
jgi:hypothetical protein